MGNEHCPELADNHWAQSLGTEWAREPKQGPGGVLLIHSLCKLVWQREENSVTRLSVCGLQVACGGFSLDFISNESSTEKRNVIQST